LFTEGFDSSFTSAQDLTSAQAIWFPVSAFPYVVLFQVSKKLLQENHEVEYLRDQHSVNPIDFQKKTSPPFPICSTPLAMPWITQRLYVALYAMVAKLY
jgi:hypothetical protein